VIDAHQHFWELARGDYGWLDEADAVLRRDFGPADLAPLLDAAGIRRSVLVQAAPTVAETRYLLEIAARSDFVAGVVGWVDFEDPGAPALLAELAGDPALCGVRPMIQDIADDDWMLGDALAPAFRTLVEQDLALDALVLPRHLSRLLALLERYPELRVVVDHGAKPAIRDGAFDPWAADIAGIARATSACCKLSGLVTEAAPGWTVDDLRPWVDHLLSCFGPDRLLWGSDWPVVELAGGYARWRAASEELLAGLSPAERSSVLGGAAERFYRLTGR